MKRYNKIKITCAVLTAFIGLTITVSCDVAYKYDIESGTDDYTANSSNVSIG
jgi:hypothetical protein